MARTTTLANLRTAVRQKSDTENATDFVGDAEVNRYINESIAELYDMLLETMGADFNLKISTVTMTGLTATSAYTLPADFYLMRRVEILSGNEHFEIRPVDSHDLRLFDGGVSFSTRVSPVIRYFISGDISSTTGAATQQLYITPRSTTGTLQVYYIPHAPILDADSDVWDGFNGWEEYVIVDAAIKILEKEESDTSALEVRKNRLINRVKAMVEARDDAFPQKIAIVEEFDW